MTCRAAEFPILGWTEYYDLYAPRLIALVVSFVGAVPTYAQYLWLLAFGGMLAHRFVGGRSTA